MILLYLGDNTEDISKIVIYARLRNKIRPTDESVGLIGLWAFYFTD